MGHYLLAALWAVLTSACAGVGSAYLIHSLRIREGAVVAIGSERVGVGLTLLVLAWFIYRFGAKRFLP